MAMSVGTITIDGLGNHSGSGLALEIFEALDLSSEMLSLAIGLPDPQNPIGIIVTYKNRMKPRAIALATAIIQHIQANAVVVGTSIT